MSTPSVLSLVDAYLTFAADRKGLRPSSVKSYRSTLSSFDDWLAGRSLVDLSPDDVEDFGWRPLRRGGGKPSPATALREIAAVVGFLKYCVGRQKMTEITAHLEVVTPKLPPAKPNPISDDVWRQLWQSDMAVDDRLWVGDAYWLGRRRSEIVTQTVEGVLSQTQQLRFTRKGGKEEVIEYYAPVAMVAREIPWITEGWEEWIELLELTARERKGEKHLCTLAFADDVSLDGTRLTKRMYQLCKNAGLERFNPHRLRHSCATNLFRAGADPASVQAFMGHESFDTTKRYMSVAGYFQRQLDGRVADWNVA